MGKPVHLDAATLATLDNEYTFNQQLHSFFSGHPKIYFDDRLNVNVLINFGLSIRPPSTRFHLQLFAIQESESEEFIRSTSFQLPYNCLLHDFLVTDNFVIILISPYVISSKNVLKSILLGSGSLGNYQQWQPELGSFVYVFDKWTFRLLSSQRMSESISYWHWINGY